MGVGDKAKNFVVNLVMKAEDFIANARKAKQAEEELRGSFDDLKKSASTITAPLKDVEKAEEDVGKKGTEAKKGVNSFGDALGDLAQKVGAVLAIQKIADFIREAGEKALEYSQAIFTMEVAVRSLQRSGMDTTIAEWRDQITQLSKQFKIFADVDIAAALSQVALLTREFGLSKDQMVDVVKVAMVYSEAMGEDLVQSVSSITRFIDTGYTKSVQAMGISINDNMLEQYAWQMGIKGSWKELDTATKAQVRLAVILDQTNVLMDDAGRITDTWAGKMKEAQKNTNNAMKDLGTTVQPILVGIQVAWAGFLSVMSTGVKALAQFFVLGAGQVAAYVAAIASSLIYLGEVLEGHAFSWEELQERMTNAAKVAMDSTVLHFSEALGLLDQSLGDDVDALNNAESDIDSTLGKITADWEKFERDVQNIQLRAAQDREDAQTRYYRKLADLETDYQRDVETINLNFARRRVEIIDRYHRQQEEDEARFQERLLRLREEYLYNLDDAVRERDARRVLDLNRRYALDLEQERREQELRRKEREEQMKWDLEMLERERQMRLEDRKLRLEQDRADAKLALERKLQDIATEEKYKLEMLMKAFAEEAQLTQEGAQKVYDILKQYYGPGGMVEGLYGYLLGVIANAHKAVNSLKGMVNSLKGISTSKTPTIAGYYAEGGTVVANKPTAAIFGEAGPEAATFTPLNRVGRDVGKVFGDVSGGGGGGGKATIRVSLGEGLVGDIVDNTMGQVAEVILSAEG